MCGRFVFVGDPKNIEAYFHLDALIEFEPHYNIVPSQNILCVRFIDGNVVGDTLRWGLIPSWAKDKSMGHRLINARKETITEKPSFRAAVKRRHCIIPASGYYEWQKMDDTKAPYYIYPKDDDYIGMAGVWERWEDAETHEEINSCTIITQDAHPGIKHLHDRMPVILDPTCYSQWLNVELDAQQLLFDEESLLDGNKLMYHSVSTLVNNPRNDVPECIAKY